MDPRRRDKRPGEPEAPARREAHEPAPLRSRPANENDPGTSMMLAKLRRSPSFAPYYVAFALSLGWIAGWFFIFSNSVIAVPDPLGPQRLAETMRALALLILPIGVVWVTAYFLWRASQLRQVSEVLMQSAMRLIRPQDIATEGLTSIAQAVRSEVDLLVGGVEHAMQRAAVLEEIVHKEISAIERAFGGNEERIRGLVAGLENQRAALHQASMVLASEANPVLARLESNTQNLGGIIVNAQSTLVQLEQGLRESSSGLARTIDEVASRAATASGQIGTQTDQMERVSSLLTGQLGEFSHQLQQQIETLSRASNSLNSESTSFGRNVQEMESNVVQLLGQSVDRLTGINREIGLAIERVSADSAGQIKQAAAGLSEIIQNTGGNITYHLNATSNEVASLIERSGIDVSQQIEQSRTLVTQGLEQVTTGYLGRIAQAQDEFTGLLDRATGNMAGTIERTASGAAQELQSAGSAINELLVSTSGTIAAHLKETSDIVGRQMQDSGLALAQNIEGSGGLVTDRLITVSGEFVQNVSKARDDLFALLDSSANEMTSRLDRTAADMTQQLESSATRIHDHIGATATDVTSRLVEATDKLTVQLDQTSGRLAGTGMKFAEIVGSAGTQIISDLGKAREALSHGLGETTLQITGRFEQDTGLLVGRIDQAARELDAAANTTSTKLDDAQRKFSKHVETANLYLADQLAGAAGALDERLEGISMQLTGKLEMSGTRISERLEDVTALVEKSLDKFNGDMERVLVNRREALDQLVADANSRAQEIDSVMTGYMKLIEDSLAASETRSKEISRIVAEQTAAATAGLEQQIKKLEVSSGGQIDQAARILREQHERAMASMNEMLSATASDFQQTAQDMRITAQQVVKDIDSARGELKRAILDLPEETRANADAMRRVVADQIAALNTLAEVVKRQTGTLDVSGPGVMLPRAMREASQGKSEDGASPAALNRPRERNEAAQSSIMRSMAVLLPRPSKEPAATESSGIPHEMENLVQKLNGAARDLVEAIDGSLPRDLEKSFNAGERNVYTHRLFETRGKRFVKMIEDRYAGERLVRGRVDAYVRLFERLLDTVSEVPQGASMVEACLASESGKLYVTLAEAAGRIPPQ